MWRTLVNQFALCTYWQCILYAKTKFVLVQCASEYGHSEKLGFTGYSELDDKTVHLHVIKVIKVI